MKMRLLQLNHYIALCFESGAHAKAMMMHIVFAKALRLHSSTVQDVTAGQLINLMSKDAAKLQEFTLFGHNLWSAPLTALWVIWGLYLVLGWPAGAGIVITIVLVPVQSQIARRSQVFRKEYMRLADTRLKMLGRVIEGIKLIKLSAWEPEVCIDTSTFPASLPRWHPDTEDCPRFRHHSRIMESLSTTRALVELAKC